MNYSEIVILATTLIGLVALVLELEHLRNRSPSKEVADKMENHEHRIAALETWRNG